MLIFCISVLSIEIHKINIQKIILFIQFIQFEFVHFGFYCPPKNGIHLVCRLLTLRAWEKAASSASKENPS